MAIELSFTFIVTILVMIFRFRKFYMRMYSLSTYISNFHR
jgi:hypothetical protein